MHESEKSEVTQSCPTLSDPTDCNLPGSSVHGIFQARVLEWVAIAFSDTCRYSEIITMNIYFIFLAFSTMYVCLLSYISEKAMAPHSSTLAWKIPWTEEPDGLQSVGSQSQTRLSDFTFTFHFHLENEMATHSSVLAWRIPGTGEPGGLPSMGLHRVRHD